MKRSTEVARVIANLAFYNPDSADKETIRLYFKAASRMAPRDVITRGLRVAFESKILAEILDRLTSDRSLSFEEYAQKRLDISAQELMQREGIHEKIRDILTTISMRRACLWPLHWYKEAYDELGKGLKTDLTSAENLLKDRSIPKIEVEALIACINDQIKQHDEKILHYVDADLPPDLRSS